MSTLELTALIGIILGGLSLCSFALAHLGLVSPLYMAAALAVCLLCVCLAVRRYLQLRSSGVGLPGLPPDEGRLSPLEWLLLLSSALCVVLIIPFDLVPPIARDELIQHLTIPALYLRKGGAVEIPFMGPSYVPMNLNMLYLAGLSFGSEALPRLTHHAFGLLTALGIYSYLRYRLPRVYCLLAALLFISTPVVMNLSRTAYVDLGATFFATMSLFALLRFKDSGRRWLYYAAVLLGLALGTKYNMIVSLALLTPMAVFISIRRGETQLGAIKAGFVFAVVAIVVFSPWLVRNLIWTGSPLYPLIGAFIDVSGTGGGLHTGGAVSPIAKRYLLYGESLLDIVMVPLRIFWEGVDGSIQKFDGVMNPLYLLFIAVAFMRRLGRDYSYLWYMLIYSLLFFAMTFFTTDLVMRYILPVLPPLVIIAVTGIRGSLGRSGIARYATMLGLLAFFVFSGLYMAGLHARYAPVAYLTGTQSRGEYLTEKLPDYATTAYANENISKDSKVLFLFTGERTYYWERDYFYGGRLGENLLDMVRGAASEDGLFDEMQGSGFTHLFIMDHIFERFAMDNFTPEQVELLRGFFAKYVKRLHSTNGFTLYSIKGVVRAD